MILLIKHILPFLLLLVSATGARSQSDTATNSLAATYKEFNPSLRYKYDEANQTHDYSNNWDFDKDGNADQVYFVGTGGAHLYYYLRVILSTDKKVRNFTFLQSDLPVLPHEAELKKPAYKPDPEETFFAVFDNDHSPAVFIRLDHSSFAVVKNDLKHKRVQTNFVTISFRNGKAIFKDYSESQ